MKNQETIAQELQVKEFPFVIRDSKGNKIYWENSAGLWYKYEYNSMQH
jgi:tartrate dehydratase beta subunit/fumarate hydratase class I family protein